MIKQMLNSVRSLERKLLKLQEKEKSIPHRRRDPDATKFRKELIKLRKYPEYLKKATEKNSKLRKEVINLNRVNRGLKRWYDIIESYNCRSKNVLKRRLEKSAVKSFGKWIEDTKEKYKLMYQAIKEGRTQGYILDEIFKRDRSASSTSAFIKGLVGTLMQHGLVIFSKGRGAERVYSLKPFEIVHEKADPHIGLKMKIVYPENYEDMKKLLDALKVTGSRSDAIVRGHTKEQICKAFSKELFDKTIEDLLEHSCCGVRTDKDGAARYFSRTSLYEFDCRVLRKEITGRELKGAKSKLIQFLRDKPGQMIEEIAVELYGDRSKRNRSRAAMAVNNTKHLLRSEKGEGRKKIWFLDDKLVTKEHAKERGET